MTENNGLYSFLRTKAASGGGAATDVDWESRKADWLKHVTELYDQVKSWLEPLEQDRTVKFQTRRIRLQEEFMGSYDAEALALVIGQQRVEFLPKGALIVGAQGRVDIQGPAAIRSLILDDGEWFVVERTPRPKALPFNQDAFHDVLQEVLE